MDHNSPTGCKREYSLFFRVKNSRIYSLSPLLFLDDYGIMWVSNAGERPLQGTRKTNRKEQKMNRIMVNDRSTLDALAKDSALTFEGMSPDEMV